MSPETAAGLAPAPRAELFRSNASVTSAATMSAPKSVIHGFRSRLSAAYVGVCQPGAEGSIERDHRPRHFLMRVADLQPDLVIGECEALRRDGLKSRQDVSDVQHQPQFM